MGREKGVFGLRRSEHHSAKGAGYNSQVQVRREAEHVAPGNEIKICARALKGRNNYFGLSGLNDSLVYVTRGDVPTKSGLAPGYHIPRLRRWNTTRFALAFGAGTRCASR